MSDRMGDFIGDTVPVTQYDEYEVLIKDLMMANAVLADSLEKCKEENRRLRRQLYRAAIDAD